MAERITMYRASKLAPIWIVATIGMLSVFYFFYTHGLNSFTKPYHWPSFILTPFFIICAVHPRFFQWHKIFWRAAQIWSGFWTILFIVSVPAAFLPLFIPLKWSLEMRVNPWLAVAMHLLMFGCFTDILKEKKKEEV